MKKNLAAIHRIYEAFGKGDIPAIIDEMAEEVEWEPWTDNSCQKAGVPWMLARNGKAGVMEYFSSITALDIRYFQVLSIMENDHKIAVEFVIEASVPATGHDYRDEEIHLWTFNNEGKVIRLRHYLDTAKHIFIAGKG